jgi:hypothetical protein
MTAFALAVMRADLMESHEEALACPLIGSAEEMDDFNANMDTFNAGAVIFADRADFTIPDHLQEYRRSNFAAIDSRTRL